MKVHLSLLIFISNLIYGNTSEEYLDEGQPEVYPSARKSADAALELNQDAFAAKKFPEQVFASDIAEEPPKKQLQLVEVAPEEHEIGQLIGKDYFRVDSGDYEMYNRASSVFEKIGNNLNPSELKQFKAEIAAGDMTQLFGTNPHYHQPDKYRDFSRRFVPQYPYREVKEEDEINQDAEENSLTPKKAPPELVLAVAKESALLDAATPVNPTEELIRKDILRSGEYWNSFWKEDVNPKEILRSKKRNKMQKISAKLPPGTEIYDIVSKLKQLYPKLIYVVNKNSEY